MRPRVGLCALRHSSLIYIWTPRLAAIQKPERYQKPERNHRGRAGARPCVRACVRAHVRASARTRERAYVRARSKSRATISISAIFVWLTFWPVPPPFPYIGMLSGRSWLGGAIAGHCGPSLRKGQKAESPRRFLGEGLRGRYVFYQEQRWLLMSY